MTGEAPQPGRTSRDESPWAAVASEPGWWHGEPDGAAGGGGPDVDARAAGVRDLTREHAGEPDEPIGGPDGSRLASAGELMIIEPGGRGADLVPDEADHGRNRPTVAFNPQRPAVARLGVPPAPPPAPAQLQSAQPQPAQPQPAQLQSARHSSAQPAAAPAQAAPPAMRPLPDVAVSPAVEARLERLENSTFWLSEAERAGLETARPADRRPGPRPRRPIENPAAAQLAMITLGLVAAFFAWVSAEPFWLAVGHGDQGYATTTRCRGDGLTQRCTGRFTTTDGRVAVSPVTLLGVSGEARAGGATSPARMVGPGSTQAYAAPAGTLMHLRWVLGFALVLLCGYGIGRATGADRLESGMRRRRATLLGFAAPLLLLAGFLVAAY